MTLPVVHVLFVDDDEDDYILTRELLTRPGLTTRYELHWCPHYEEARQALGGGEFDLCLLDYRLGVRTGLELLEETRGLHQRPPVILLTGQGDPSVDLAAMQAGAVEYLIKSELTAEGLDRAIRYALERRKNEERLRRDRDLIGRIMETSPVGIVVTDRLGRVTFANARAEQVLGGNRGAGAVIPHLSEWPLLNAESGAAHAPGVTLKQALETGRPVHDLRGLWDDGQRRLIVSINAAPLMDPAGGIEGLVVTVDDITERVHLEERLRQSQRMKSIGQLAAGVAHDINNVLTVIQGHAELLREAIPSGRPEERSVRQICAAADRAARFVRQLLLFSRKQVVQFKRLDLGQVLHNLAPMLSRLLGEDIHLELDCTESIPPIDADLGMIEQVILNLAVNARDAMPRGGQLRLATSLVSVQEAEVVRRSAPRPGAYVCLTVTDTGCGMDAATLARIFEPFFSTKETGKGTGLGLATVYGIVKQHQGWIEVTSQVGLGSTFRVYLPAASGPAGVSQDTEFQRRPRGRRQESILVVEDEPDLRELVQEVLLACQYTVYTAATGLEALGLWDRIGGGVDLLLTDVVMPQGIDGHELAERLRQRKPDLRVIYTSGYSGSLAGRQLQLRDGWFLPKPYRPGVLARVIRACLDSPIGAPPPPDLDSVLIEAGGRLTAPEACGSASEAHAAASSRSDQ
ncbi:MAG: response regulator [Verrucomicrobiota bacterium]|nr:response regulator [Limisphaera sp.]MDW8382509.1 response regulator [Verrucomicrobiota bacterium]